MASTEHSLSAGYGSPAAAPAASRGRGAVTNVPHRFQQSDREGIDDGWHSEALDAASHSATDALDGLPGEYVSDVADFIDDISYRSAEEGGHDAVESLVSEPVPDYDLAVDDDFSDLDIDPAAQGLDSPTDDVPTDDFPHAGRSARRAERFDEPSSAALPAGQVGSAARRAGFWDRVPVDRGLASGMRSRAVAAPGEGGPRQSLSVAQAVAQAVSQAQSQSPAAPQPQPQARAALEQRAARTTVVYPVAYPPVPPSLRSAAANASGLNASGFDASGFHASGLNASGLSVDPGSASLASSSLVASGASSLTATAAHDGMPPYTGADAGAARALTEALQAAARAANEACGGDPNEAPVVFFPRRAFISGADAAPMDAPGSASGGLDTDAADNAAGLTRPGTAGNREAVGAGDPAALGRPSILPTGGALKTTVKAEQARKLLSRNDSPDIPFDQAVNPYRGCEHGCVYCYARPTHACLGYSPGLDFETRLIAKANAVEALRAELAKPGYKVSPINIGSATDVYQPIERTWKLTRGLLELMDETGHPATLVTKNSLIERDLDVLQRLAARNLITVYMSITTLDSAMSRTLEPRASAPWRRIQTVRTLARAGIPVSVNVAPVIPFINDDALEQILEQSAAAGARSASYTVVRLPWEVKDVFEAWLHTHFPDRAQRVLHRIEDMRSGRLNDPDFGTRMRGTGIWADLIKQRFQVAMRRLSFRAERPVLSCEHFVPPQQAPRVSRREQVEQARREGQLDLF